MKNLLKFISYLGLLLTILPAFLVFYRIIYLEFLYTLMAIGMVLWFATAPLWLVEGWLINRQKEEEYNRS